MLTHLPLVLTSKRTYFSLLPFFFFCFSFLVSIDSPRGFCLGTSGLYVSCFNQINPLSLLLTHSLSPCSSNVHLTVQCIVLYSYINGLSQYFSVSNIFCTSPASHRPLRQTNALFSLTVYLCVYVYDHTCFYIYI
jgi:hypothetical protein